MAGAGFDARMIGDADGGLKDRVGRLAYVWTGAKHLREKPFRAKIVVDGARWYDGEASCILLGNVGKLFGGVEAFEDAHPDDGVLELGVVSADGVREWAGTIARAVVGTASKSPHAFTTKVHSVRIKLDRKVPYEIDGGDRKKVRKLRIEIEPEAVADLRRRDRSALSLPRATARGGEVALVEQLERPAVVGLGRAAPDRELRAALVQLEHGDRVVERHRRHEPPGRVGRGGRRRCAPARGRRRPAARVLRSLTTRRSRGLSGFRKGEQTIWKTRLSCRGPSATSAT